MININMNKKNEYFIRILNFDIILGLVGYFSRYTVIHFVQ